MLYKHVVNTSLPTVSKAIKKITQIKRENFPFQFPGQDHQPRPEPLSPYYTHINRGQESNYIQRHLDMLGDDPFSALHQKEEI